MPNEAWREYYFTSLGKTLSSAGHKVVWWTSNFSHHFKKCRDTGWAHIEISPGFNIVLVPATRYRSHVGIGRYVSETVFALNVLLRAASEPAPDIVIGGDSPQPASGISLFLARHYRVPLILAAMDQWPELFVLVVPRALRWCAPLALAPLYWIRRFIRRHADGIVSLSARYLHEALADIPHSDHVEAVTIFNGIDVKGFRRISANCEDDSHSAAIPRKKPKDIWVIFAGTLGNNYDVPTIVDSAALLQRTQPDVKFLIAGSGPEVALVRDARAVRGILNIEYVGILPHNSLARLYAQCDVALCAYGAESNVGMPDKLYDYLAAGLPVVNSLRGEVESLILDKEIGQQYNAGDPESLAACIAKLAADDGLRLRQAKNSYTLAMDFDRNTQFRKINDLVAKLLLARETKCRESCSVSSQDMNE